MRVLKLAFISVFVFFALFTAMSLFIPSHIRISKAITLSSTADSVITIVGDTTQWPRWHPALKGSTGNTLHQHKIAVTPVEKTDSTVVLLWQQPGKSPVQNGWQLHRFGNADSVALQWYMDFRFKWYPWQKFGSLFYESTYGRMMEVGLQNIKKLTEQAPTSLREKGKKPISKKPFA